MVQNVAVIGLRYFFVDFIGGIVLFPVWWYTRGLVRAWKFSARNIQDYREILGIRVWIKNIFVPMYGSYDISGRLISFFMRVVQIIIRSIGLAVLTFAYLVLFAVYVVLPVFVIFELLFHLIGVL